MTSIKWKVINSLWVILAFIPLISGFAFIFAGLRVKKKLWICFGIIVSLSWIPSIEGIVDSSLFFNILGPINAILWYAGMFYVFYVLREYLVRLEAIEKNENYKDKIFEEYNLQGKTMPTSLKNDNVQNNLQYSEQNNIQELYSDINQDKFSNLSLIDINKDSEDKLSLLPGINLILAKKIVKIRSSGYEFHSVEDLAEKLNLKPHIIEKLRPLVVFSNTKKAKLKGRKVDF